MNTTAVYILFGNYLIATLHRCWDYHGYF